MQFPQQLHTLKLLLLAIDWANYKSLLALVNKLRIFQKVRAYEAKVIYRLAFTKGLKVEINCNCVKDRTRLSTNYWL